MFSLKRSSELLLAPGLAWHFHHEISSCLPCDSWMNWNGTFSFELGKNMIETNQRHTWSSKTLKSGHQVVVNILQKEKKPTTEELDCAVWGVMNGLCEHASNAFIFASSGQVIKFVLRAASTLEKKDSELRALRKFSATRNLTLIKRNVLRQEIRLTPFNHWSELFTAITSGRSREIGSLRRRMLKEI